MPHDLRTPQQRSLVLANARIVLETETVTGSIAVQDGRIAALDTGAGVPAGAEDCGGDYLAPGLVELHTDNLERHLEPRPGVRWPEGPAILAHDGELAGVGITTVFDALRVGSLISGGKSGYRRYARPLATEINRLHRAGALRIRHRLHLRAEVCSETLVEELDEFAPEDRVGILSLMDHTPGQRQFTDISKLRAYTSTRRGMNEDEFQAHVAGLRALGARIGARHETAAVEAARRLGATLASHDDATEAQVAASAAHGARIAEFPTTAEAAAACRRQGIAVMIGAPNLIRGGSHSGNVSAAALAEAGLLDILSSDYAPASLLLGAVRLGTLVGDMAAGIARVTSAPARAAGLADRGRIAPGLLADLVRFRVEDGHPIAARRLGRRRAGRLRRTPALLSYQHAYHAGGPADLHKHIVLAELLARLTAKPRGIAYVETHAGRGLYDLASPEALKTGEAAQGIARIDPDPATPFGRALAAVRAEAGRTAYPGSPLVAQALLRPQDRLTLMELHPAEHAALARRGPRRRDPPPRRLRGRPRARALPAAPRPRPRRPLLRGQVRVRRRRQLRAPADRQVARGRGPRLVSAPARGAPPRASRRPRAAPLPPRRGRLRPAPGARHDRLGPRARQRAARLRAALRRRPRAGRVLRCLANASALNDQS